MWIILELSIWLIIIPQGPRTKHIDIRTHFVRELIMKGILKVEFIKSEENDADIFTKNVSEELFHKHSEKLIDKSPKI